MPQKQGLSRRNFLIGAGLASASIAPLADVGLFAPAARATNYPFRANQTLVDAFVARRGSIGTNGRPAVAFRCDHHLNKFKELVLPLHQRYDIPVTIAVGSETIEREVGRDGSNKVSWRELETLSLRNGFEIANHGATHADVSTSSGLRREIVHSQISLRRKMPQLPVELWAQPGTGGTYYGGLHKPSQTLSRFGSTLAGRTVLNYHAVSTGYVGRKPYSYLWPMTGNPLDSMGAFHMTSDEGKGDTGLRFSKGASYLRNVASYGGGMCFMYHPSLMGPRDLAELEEFFQYCAAQRAAGKLEILTTTGLMMADFDGRSRHDLLGTPLSFTKGANGWSVVASKWAIRVEDRVRFARRGGRSTALSKTVDVGDYKGSTRELRVKVRSTTGVRLRLAVNDPGTGALAVSRDIWVPASSRFTTHRLYVTVPLSSRRLRVTLTPRTSGELHVMEPQLLAA